MARVPPGYFFSRRLEAMGRGEVVTAPTYMLPREVRQGAAYQTAIRGVGRWGNPIRRPLTATVHPNGLITYADETFEEMCENVLPGEPASLLPGEAPE